MRHKFDRKNKMKKKNPSEIAVSIAIPSPTSDPVEGWFVFDPIYSISRTPGAKR